MTTAIGVLCSGEGLEMAALIEAVETGRLPAEIRLVITDRDSPALSMARAVGLNAAFIPRSAFHANRDGFERRLVDLLTQAGAEVLVLAGFIREVGPVLAEAFPDKIFGQNLGPDELVDELERKFRSSLFSLVSD